MKKLKLAIFDLTDCEGCELQFLALREKLAKAGDDLEIENWRLANTRNNPGPYDVTFIEGSPITEADIEIIKQARAVSKKIVTLGSCAVLGGIQASISEKSRAKNLKEIYGEKYKVKTKAPKPVSYYIEVDFQLPGCPISTKELENVLSSLLVGKKLTPISFPVCLECKAKSMACLFLDQGFCLGPVTKGGCGAVCPGKGLHCYGCFGPLPGTNLNAIKKASRYLSDAEIDNYLKLFFSNADQYKEFKIKKTGGKSFIAKAREDKNG